jgi:hypothetical protein
MANPRWGRVSSHTTARKSNRPPPLGSKRPPPGSVVTAGPDTQMRSARFKTFIRDETFVSPGRNYRASCSSHDQQRGAADYRGAPYVPRTAARRHAMGTSRSRRDGGEGKGSTMAWRACHNGMPGGGRAGHFRAMDHPAGASEEGRTARLGGVVGVRDRGTGSHPRRPSRHRKPPQGFGTDSAVITELATRLVHGARFTAEPRTVFGELLAPLAAV